MICCHGLSGTMAHCRPVTWPVVRNFLKASSSKRQAASRAATLMAGQAASGKLQATSLDNK